MFSTHLNQWVTILSEAACEREVNDRLLALQMIEDKMDDLN